MSWTGKLLTMSIFLLEEAVLGSCSLFVILLLLEHDVEVIPPVAIVVLRNLGHLEILESRRCEGVSPVVLHVVGIHVV